MEVSDRPASGSWPCRGSMACTVEHFVGVRIFFFFQMMWKPWEIYLGWFPLLTAWHSGMDLYLFLSPAWGMSRRTLPPYFFLCGPPPYSQSWITAFPSWPVALSPVATGEKMMCEKCNHSYRFQIVFLKADKELQIIKSSVSVSVSLSASLILKMKKLRLWEVMRPAELRRASCGQNLVSEASGLSTRLAAPLPRAQDSFSVQHSSSGESDSNFSIFQFVLPALSYLFIFRLAESPKE